MFPLGLLGCQEPTRLQRWTSANWHGGSLVGTLRSDVDHRHQRGWPGCASDQRSGHDSACVLSCHRMAPALHRCRAEVPAPHRPGGPSHAQTPALARTPDGPRDDAGTGRSLGRLPHPGRRHPGVRGALRHPRPVAGRPGDLPRTECDGQRTSGRTARRRRRRHGLGQHRQRADRRLGVAGPLLGRRRHLGRPARPGVDPLDVDRHPHPDVQPLRPDEPPPRRAARVR